MNNQTHLDLIRESCSQVLAGGSLSSETAVSLLASRGPDVVDLMAAANRVRHQFKGDDVHLCALINAKSGRCSEDCAFCAQSVHSDSEAKTYPLMSVEEIFESARAAESTGADSVGIVMSGLAPTDAELDVLCEAARRIRNELSIFPDASLGMLTVPVAEKLKASGFYGYHHNVETAESFFEQVCSTHSWGDHLRTLSVAISAGFRVCSGGIFGLGESLEQRIELAETMRRVNPDRVCLNFLIPVPGTRLSQRPLMRPIEILKLIAVFRLMLPTRDINVCAGREMHLRDMQGMIFFAGANVTMIGNYLTQIGRPAGDDLRMLSDLELNRPRGAGDVDSAADVGYNIAKD